MPDVHSTAQARARITHKIACISLRESSNRSDRASTTISARFGLADAPSVSASSCAKSSAPCAAGHRRANVSTRVRVGVAEHSQCHGD